MIHGQQETITQQIAREAEKKQYDEIHAALCANHCTSAVADFLADLAIRLRRLEQVESLRAGI